MFTGIIETTGRVRTLQRKAQGASMQVEAPGVADSLKIGDSIAVNGVCLTVTGFNASSFSTDLSLETLDRTTLGSARAGLLVNLERPLALSDRLGGHFVQGHVDGVGKLATAVPAGDGVTVGIDFPTDLARYFVPKGSVAVDGISLTIAALGANRFTVAVIPHTWNITNLRQLRPGDAVNIEVDMLGKYIERFLQLGLVNRDGRSLTPDYLKEQGF